MVLRVVPALMINLTCRIPAYSTLPVVFCNEENVWFVTLAASYGCAQLLSHRLVPIFHALYSSWETRLSQVSWNLSIHVRDREFSLKWEIASVSEYLCAHKSVCSDCRQRRLLLPIAQSCKNCIWRGGGEEMWNKCKQTLLCTWEP